MERRGASPQGHRPSSRATTRRSLRGERRPLSSAEGIRQWEADRNACYRGTPSIVNTKLAILTEPLSVNTINFSLPSR
jgi:hypothetical protein